MRVRVFLRRETCDCLKQTVKVARTAPNRSRQGLKRQFLLAALDEATRSRNYIRSYLVGRLAIGITPFARSESGRLCFGKRGMKPYVFRIGGAGWARRAAIDTRRENRIPKDAVGVPVPRYYPRPARIVGYCL